VTSQNVKNNSSAVSKANLHLGKQAAQLSTNTGLNQESATSTAPKSRRRTRERLSRMVNGLGANQGAHPGMGGEAANGVNVAMAQMQPDFRIFQSP